MFISLSIILFINGYKANSQQVVSVDKWVEYVEEMALETENEEQIESLYADLSYRAEHPFALYFVAAYRLIGSHRSRRAPRQARIFRIIFNDF